MSRPLRSHCYARIGLHALNVVPNSWLAYITAMKVLKLRKEGVGIIHIPSFWIELVYLVSYLLTSICGGVTCFTDSHLSQDLSQEDLDLLSDYNHLNEVETRLEQMTRIFQAILLFAGFIKVLINVQIYEDLSFLIKMMSVVIVELVPFFILFISLIGIFAFMVGVLGVSLIPGGEESDYEGLGAQAIGYFFFVLR
jgi:hypothetical protein